jgi:hypothetical protein
MLVLLGGAAAVVGADDAVGSVEPVCAPPLLLIVTPEPTSVVDEVAPDVVVVPVVVVVGVLVDVDPVLVDVDVGVVDEVEVPVAAEPVDDVSVDVESAELVEDDSEDVLVVSAAANP